MRQLNSIDAAFLVVESPEQPEQHGLLLVLDSSEPVTLEQLRSHMAERLAVVAPLRWRLCTVPGGIDHPYWVEDPNPDLDHHVRELELPPPATDEHFAELVSWIAGRRLDRSRHMWMAYLIHGLSGGRVAMLLMVHHAAVDGAGVIDLLDVLTDAAPAGPDEPFPPAPPAERLPSRPVMLAHGVAGIGRYWWRAATLLRHLPTVAPQLESMFAQPEGSSRLRRRRGDRPPRTGAPRVSFNLTPSADPRWVYAVIDFERVRAVKNSFACTVNDVILAISAGAVRRWLIAHDELPTDPLMVRVPVAKRSAAQHGRYGNELGVISAPFFTNEPDPVRRLALTHEALLEQKKRIDNVPDELARDLLSLIPAPLGSPLARFFAATRHKRGPAVNIGVAGITGSRTVRYVFGAPIVEAYSVNMTPDGPGVTSLTYNGSLHFCVVADHGLVPDIWNVMRWVVEELEELERLRP